MGRRGIDHPYDKAEVEASIKPMEARTMLMTLPFAAAAIDLAMGLVSAAFGVL